MGNINHPVDRTYTLYSMVKRAVMIPKRIGNYTATHPIAIADEFTMNALGFKHGSKKQKEFVFYTAEIEPNKKDSHESWDNVLGPKWDLIPGDDPGDFDTFIKFMKFSVSRDFVHAVIKLQISTVNGMYRGQQDYRALYRRRLAETKKQHYT